MIGEAKIMYWETFIIFVFLIIGANDTTRWVALERFASQPEVVLLTVSGWATPDDGHSGRWIKFLEYGEMKLSIYGTYHFMQSFTRVLRSSSFSITRWILNFGGVDVEIEDLADFGVVDSDCGWINENCGIFEVSVCIEDFFAVPGGKVMLPCNISSSKDEIISMILWYKGEGEVPIYTLDARRSPIQKARHFPSVELGARVYFDISQKLPRLKMDHVKEEDEGEYRCRIDFRRSRTVIRSVNLVVIVPPETVQIKDENGMLLSETSQPYNEDTDLKLICEVYGGNPPPAVTWWRQGILLDDSYSPVPQGVVRNELFLSRLKRSDLLTEFICQASNTNLTTPKSATIVIDLNLKPVDVQLLPVSHISAGKRTKLTCESTGSRPPAVITWLKEGKKLHGAEDIIIDDSNVTTSVLSIVPAVDDNGKVLSCRSHHRFIFHAELEDSWVMNVFYIPIINLKFGVNIQETGIKEGSDVYFECSIKANPWVKEVGWNFEGKPLHSNTSAGIIVSNQSLVLQKILKEQRGHYQCSAANVEGEGFSNKLLLQVQYSPICKHPSKTIYGVFRDEPTSIVCEVDANPKDITFHWSLNNSVDITEITTHTSNGTSSTVTYTPWTMLGYGILLCWGQNIIGHQKEPCIIKLMAAGPPDSLKSCQVTNRTTASLIIECEAGYDGGMQQQFHLEIYNSAIEHLQTNLTSLDQPTFVVKNLPEGTSYVLVLYASNIKGRSDSVALVTSTLQPAERRIAKDEITTVSPILGVLIGVIGSLVLLALIVTLVVKLHYDRPEKDSIPSDGINKCDTPLKKHADDMMESTEKGPDIIPPNTDGLPGYNGADISDRLFHTSEMIYPSVMPITGSLCSTTGEEEMKYRQCNLGSHYIVHRPSTENPLKTDFEYPELFRSNRMFLEGEDSSQLPNKYRNIPDQLLMTELQKREMGSSHPSFPSALTTAL